MFLRILIAAWVLYLLSLVLLYFFPHFVIDHLLLGHGRIIGYALVALLLVTAAYRIASLYRAGMAKAFKR